MKILYVTTVGSTMGFFRSLVRKLLDKGYQVDIACNKNYRPPPIEFRQWDCNIYQIDCSRSPLKTGNIRAIREIQEIVTRGNYDIVHCHTPVAAMCTRLACMNARRHGVCVFYTAHGFHFFKGAPLKNWLLFFPIEWVCSFFTDVLITINSEDYTFSKNRLHASHTLYVPGVGIDIQSFHSVEADVQEIRRSLDIPEDSYVVLSVGELNSNKNHELVLKALSLLKNDHIYYLIAGKGELLDYLKQRAEELGLGDRFRPLGFRADVALLFKAADLMVHPSFREGLPVSVMEAIAAGTPVLCSDIRGSRDLTLEEQRFDPNSPEELADLIQSSMMGELNRTRENFDNLHKYDSQSTDSMIMKAYDSVISEQ